MTDPTTTAVLHVRLAQTLTKTSATQAASSTQLSVYDAVDCSGTARAVYTVSGSGNSLRIDGSQMAGSVLADKVTVSNSALFPGLSAATVTVNGVRFANNYGAAGTSKDIYFVIGRSLSSGDFTKPLDAQGYPTALLATPIATLQ